MLIQDKEYVFIIDGVKHHCALDVTMSYIGGKWKTVVLWYLRNRTYRFGELKKQIPDITEKMLSLQLKALEDDGLVRREVFAEVPLRVEYSLTDFGKTLVPVLTAIAGWGRQLAESRGTLVEVEKGKG
ncbi:winged helix-turn-helix transcriptional regulator [Cesiribacter andamanensis]|uniref:HTH-type transcriptional activator hxlR n=1 Tax=Cesiribacter andamanensis AMV16 TaxID=1279009 RepID=M7NNF8_9BACT|nr:helix-turn-helix domain-containing protein [Cesiribacter andamanensis]EMR03250.1 HTH-type transcriptional activator hxlR [Cesiribacter andamanensis AMV16]